MTFLNGFNSLPQRGMFMKKELLKGNYPAKPVKGAEQKETVDPKSLEKEFETSAFEKLGGSIAFVKKSSKFVWKGE